MFSLKKYISLDSLIRGKKIVDGHMEEFIRKCAAFIECVTKSATPHLIRLLNQLQKYV